jgi:BlaI family transcriptional regulator, penicillinase repressor
MRKPDQLTRRERQIMELLFALGEGTVNDVRDKLSDDPSYSSIRAAMTRLVAKGELNYSEQGPRYVYSPAVQLNKARRSALKNMIDTFFGGSSLKTMTALLDEAAKQLTAEELEELHRQVAEAKRRKAR